MLLAQSIANYAGAPRNFIAYQYGMRVDRLEQAMEAKGYSQSSLAREIGATQGAIQQIISGRTKTSRLLPEIADALGVSVQWLKGKSDDMAGAAPAPAANGSEQEPELPLPTVPLLVEVLEGLLEDHLLQDRLKEVRIRPEDLRSAAVVLRVYLEHYAKDPTGFAQPGQSRKETASITSVSRLLLRAG